MHDYAAAALPFLMVVFMAGNLAAVGLELDFGKALMPLRNARFVVVVLAWAWLLCPGFAWLLVRVVPMAEPYGLGLMLIGMAPAAPFLPMMVRRAGGDLAYAAAYMLIAAFGTVLFMPLALPLLVPELVVGTWAIAKPLIVFLLVPMVVGMVIRTWRPALAGFLHRWIKRLADAATLALLGVIGLLYFRGFVEAVGSYAIGTQLLFAVGVTVGSYLLSAGLPPEQRSVVSLGTCTRNLGAALAPVLAVRSDPRTTVMIALGIPIGLLVTLIAARWYEARAARSGTRMMS